MSKIVFIIFLAVFISKAEATKCLKAKNLDELKKDFPIIVSGEIVSKKQLNKKLETFELKVKVVRYVSGNSNKQFFKGVVMEPIKILDTFSPYEISKTYIFPIQKTKNKGEFEIIIPALGCPVYLEN
jgi:hypothetical protein